VVRGSGDDGQRSETFSLTQRLKVPYTSVLAKALGAEPGIERR
jgi:hypothetical protein